MVAKVRLMHADVAAAFLASLPPWLPSLSQVVVMAQGVPTIIDQPPSLAVGPVPPSPGGGGCYPQLVPLVESSMAVNEVCHTILVIETQAPHQWAST